MFRVETALVQVDAVLADRQGGKVKDLTAADFEVFQDGVPLPVTDAAYIEQHHPAGVPREDVPTRPALPALATPQPAQPGLPQRVIVLLADDLNLSFENAHAVRHLLDMPIEKRGPHMVRAVARDAWAAPRGSS